jgi:transposase
MLTMYQQITILTLRKQGVKQAAIAKQFGCHRNTVRNIIKRETPIEKCSRQKPSQFDQYHQQIKEWLDQNITNLRIHELLSGTYGIGQTYTGLCKYIQKRFPKQVEAFGVQLTDPGDEAELDFGYLGKLPGKDGKPVKTWGIAIILAYSRVGYYGICYDQKVETLISEVEKAFAYFGGVPKKVKVDNMKTAVICNRRYELEFNQEFLEFAKHYNFVVVPCTPYSPEQKGKVEAGVKYLKGNFVSGREFKDGADLTRQLQDWMRT